jgi:hypothetical protein
LEKMTPTRRDDGGRVDWRVRIRWWQLAKWPHNGDRVVRSDAAQTKQFDFDSRLPNVPFSAKAQVAAAPSAKRKAAIVDAAHRRQTAAAPGAWSHRRSEN